MNCYHCQQPVPAGIHIQDSHGHAYCCHACEALYDQCGVPSTVFNPSK